MSPANEQFNVMTIRSAFYTPVIACARRFMKDEHLEPNLRFREGHDINLMLMSGEVDIGQSAPSSAMEAIARGDDNPPMHVANINDRDGFYIVGRKSEPAFRWTDLEGAALVPASFGSQPEACLRFCLIEQRVDAAKIEFATGLNGMKDAQDAFRNGVGDYVHLQDPLARELVHEGAGHVVASVGEALGPISFSSLATSRETIAAKRTELVAFIRAYVRTLQWIRNSDSNEIVKVIEGDFPGVNRQVLADAIAGYQTLGTWLVDPVIGQASYDRTVDMALASPHLTGVTQRYPYATCCDASLAKEAVST